MTSVGSAGEWIRYCVTAELTSHATGIVLTTAAGDLETSESAPARPLGDATSIGALILLDSLALLFAWQAM